jgi:hypothetical protein
MRTFQPIIAFARPQTPVDLSAEGYRIERGSDEPGAEYGPNQYWWTWMMEDCDIDTSNQTFDTPEQAIEDARSDAAQWD